jgi:hypothetical protein
VRERYDMLEVTTEENSKAIFIVSLHQKLHPTTLIGKVTPASEEPTPPLINAEPAPPSFITCNLLNNLMKYLVSAPPPILPLSISIQRK